MKPILSLLLIAMLGACNGDNWTTNSRKPIVLVGKSCSEGFCTIVLRNGDGGTCTFANGGFSNAIGEAHNVGDTIIPITK